MKTADRNVSRRGAAGPRIAGVLALVTILAGCTSNAEKERIAENAHQACLTFGDAYHEYFNSGRGASDHQTLKNVALEQADYALDEELAGILADVPSSQYQASWELAKERCTELGNSRVKTDVNESYETFGVRDPVQQGHGTSTGLKRIVSPPDRELILDLIEAEDPDVGSSRPPDLITKDALWVCEEFDTQGVEEGLDSIFSFLDRIDTDQRTIEYYESISAVAVRTICTEHESDYWSARYERLAP